MSPQEFEQKAKSFGYERDPQHANVFRKGISFIGEGDLEEMLKEMETAANSVMPIEETAA
jgi:hypothetical protein